MLIQYPNYLGNIMKAYCTMKVTYSISLIAQGAMYAAFFQNSNTCEYQPNRSKKRTIYQRQNYRIVFGQTIIIWPSVVSKHVFFFFSLVILPLTDFSRTQSCH